MSEQTQTVEEAAEKLNGRLNEIKTIASTKAEKAEVEAIQIKVNDLMEKGATKEDINAEISKLTDIVQAQAKSITDLQSKGGPQPKTNIKEAFEKSKEAVKKVYQSGGGGVEIFSQKVVGAMSTGNLVAGATIAGQQLFNAHNADEINGFDLRLPFIEQYATVGRTNKPVYVYTDFIPGEGAVTFVGEAGAKPLIDFDIENRSITPKKVAAHEILSEESLDDIPMMDSMAKEYLFKQVMLKRQNGILFGDGTGNTPIGVTSVANGIDTGTLTDQVTGPNLYDCIIAAATQIYTTVNHVDDVQYMPNVVFVNPMDFAVLKLSKQDGQYLFPQFTLMNETQIGNMQVIAKSEVPVGSILLGDFTRLKILNYIDYSVRLGWINAQFTSNQFTMVGESRFYTIIKSLDEKAFFYDTIANVAAQITDA